MSAPFTDRREAGRRLAAGPQHLAGRPYLIILGLPRGGVPVAYEVAKSLRVLLDVILVGMVGFSKEIFTNRLHTPSQAKC